MTQTSTRIQISWWLAFSIFYVLLAVWAVQACYEVSKQNELRSALQTPTGFPGNDWVDWENQDGKVIAIQVHPLQTYKTFPPEKIAKGDRLRKIDYHEIYQAETVNKIMEAAPPGKTFIFQVERPNPLGGAPQFLNLRVINGFELVFTFNQEALYWRIGVWVTGIGTFAAFVIILILFPFIRNSWKAYRSLFVVVAFGFLLFAWQMAHTLYLIVESDLVRTSFEPFFIFILILVLVGYSVSFFYFKSGKGKFFYLIPSLVAGGGMLYQVYESVFLTGNIRLQYEIWEKYAILFFLIHTVAGIVLFIISDARELTFKNHWIAGSIGLLMAIGIGYYAFGDAVTFEENLLLWNLLLFFPLINSAFSQLRFGKISLVVTRTLQYVIFFAFCLLLFFLIKAVFDTILPNNPYRQVMEIITLVGSIMIVQVVYRANERKFNAYFISSQQEKSQRMQTFIATIPQFPAENILRESLTDQLSEYFEASPVDLWWNSQQTDPSENEKLMYEQLVEERGVWSRNKELSGFRFEDELETNTVESPYSLVLPVVVTDNNFGLIMLGRKKKRVYNLSDLEILSRLVQQTQLTLNVLQLVNRESDLIQQTYEANLTALRSQINPHFLFNTLNTISALIHDSPILAEDAIEKLAFIFRYTLKHSNQNLVSLENEIKLVTTYLEIEQIRFGARLKVDIEVDQDVKNVMLPAFVIQTLIENCIKHGIAKIIEKGIVSIDAYRENGFLVCEMYDNGPGIDPERISKGTGLNNIIARLENMYEIKNLLYFENTGQGTRVELKIPIT